MRVVLVGGGEVAYFLTKAFLSKGYPVSVINNNLSECQSLSKGLKALVIHGDGSDPSVMEDAGAREAQLLIAVTPYDHINLVCCQTGSVLFKIPKTLALVNDPDNFKIFKLLGIDHVFNQTELIVSMLEKQLEYSNMNHLLSYAEGQALINEIMLKESMASAGKKISDLKLGDSTDILGVNRDGRFHRPDPELELKEGDRILLLSNPQQLAPSLREICGEEA